MNTDAPRQPLAQTERTTEFGPAQGRKLAARFHAVKPADCSEQVYLSV